MSRKNTSFALFVLLFSSLHLSDVIANDVSTLSLEEQILEIQQKLEELFSTRNKRLEQITAENILLRKTVENLSWEAGQLEESMKTIELDHSLVEWNITRVSEQFDNTMSHQHFCAKDDSLQDLFDEYYLTCGAPPPSTVVYRSCSEAPAVSGVYRIAVADGSQIEVFCEQQLEGGGWLVFQSRLDGSVDFNRSWDDYQNGFGNASGEYWLGLDNLNYLTTGGAELLIDMEDFAQTSQFMWYSHFEVGSAATQYKLYINGFYEGSAGDSFSSYFAEVFATFDRKNGIFGNCAEILASGFWHYDCGSLRGRNNLNGIYGFNKGQQGVWWGTFRESSTQNRSPLKKVRMMVREQHPFEHTGAVAILNDPKI